MRTQFLFLLVGVIFLGVAGFLLFSSAGNNQASNTKQEQYQTYTNDRFGFSVEYPATIFTNSNQSQNNDGIVLSSDTKDITLRAYASHNVENASITELIEEARDDFQTVEVNGRQDDAELVGTDQEGNEMLELIRIRHDDVFRISLMYPQGVLTDDTVRRIKNSFVVEAIDNTDTHIPVSWNTYRNDKFDFTFSYPPEAEVSIESGRIKIQVFGPDTIPNAEVTDGFTLFLRTIPKDSSQSLKALAEARYNDETSRKNGVSAPTQIQIGNTVSYSFSVESELGSVVTYHLLEKSDTDAYEASITTADPSDRGYAEVVSMIERTFESRTVDSSASSPDFTTVSVAVLDQEYQGDPERGCDQISFIERNVPKTMAPLNAALTELFSIDDLWITDTQYNFISKTNDTLRFDRATLEDGLAKIYLNGELSGLAGVCDTPRATIQVEETALQFDTVQKVQIFMNGQRVDTIH